MNWWLIVGGVVIAFIGGTMVHDGKSPAARWLGLFVVMTAGVLFSFGVGIPEWAGWEQLDSTKCAQYAYMDGNWACVPWEQGG